MPESTPNLDYSTFSKNAGSEEKVSLLSEKLVEPKREASATMGAPDILAAIFWVGTWLSSGIMITIFLKYLSSPEIGFQFMSTLTLSHFICQSLFLRGVFKCTDFFGEYESMRPEHRKAIIGVGLYTGLDIVLTNFAFGYLSLGCQTMLKNLSPLAIYLVSCLWGVETWKHSVLVVITVICTSCALTVTDVHASFLGVVMLLAAVGFAGCRWVSVQSLCGSYKSMQQMALTQPFAALSLLPYVLVMEAPHWFSAKAMPLMGYVYALGTVACSIFLVLSMYKITEYTSATTMSVLGNARGLFLILYGAVILGENRHYTYLGWLGIIGNVAGIFVYGHLKRAHAEEAKARKNNEVGTRTDEKSSFYQLAGKTEKCESDFELDSSMDRSQRVQ